MKEEQFKGMFGLAAIWVSWFIGYLPQIQTMISILASTAAFFASIVYAIYYLRKLKREK